MRGVGYNICPTAAGGDNITHHPDRAAFIQMMSEISTGEGNAMFGRKHTESALAKQKDKAKGRFTLDWFVQKYGTEVGQKKYEERRLMLANRPSISREPWNKEKTMSPWKEKEGWLERRKKTEDYLANHYEEFRQLVLSEKYSQRQLCKIVGMGRTAMKKHYDLIKSPEGV
jgi:hypothetical protein